MEGTIAALSSKSFWLGPALAGLAAAALFTIAPTNAVRSTPPADLVLILAIDVSASVDDREFDLQRHGLARAFRHPAVLAAISSGPTRQISLAIVQWSGRGQRAVVLPWTLVRGPESAARISTVLAEMPRRYHGGQTDIAGMIRFTTRQALTAPVDAPRRVVDISGDGLDNVAYSTHEERDRAVLAGLTLNALAIRNEVPDLDHYFRSFVIGGPLAFVMTADDYEAFAVAIRRKLVR
ncbi:MAG: DUF1194 domain-containing protein, partial [Hyphomicrobiaceae bacterium]